MFAGRSYQHRHQGLGKHFVPGRLSGYYNDLSGKIEWHGRVDQAGIPVIPAPGGKLDYHAIGVMQKALGHWDVWFASGMQSTYHWETFSQIARWALDFQDENGGWEIWPRFGKKGALPYSAMAQGEAISVLVRAFSVIEDEAYMEGARAALAPMLTPIDEGGTSWRGSEGLILEEVPYKVPNTILNGWIFALFGLYDLTLVDDSPDVREALEASLNALLAHLRTYDAGFWSFYDTSGTFASPFYHRLHIAQLKALGLVYPQYEKHFGGLRKSFEEHLASPLRVTRAVALKSYQKLHHPPEELKR